MPVPIPDSAEDKALWARAELIAQALVNEEDLMITNALDNAFDYRQGLETDTPPDSPVLEPLFEEARQDLEGAKVLAYRIWDIINGHIWNYSPIPATK